MDEQNAGFLKAAFTAFTHKETGSILDFGCGAGALVRALSDIGLESHGCDLRNFGYADEEKTWKTERFRFIQTDPYRLPYEDNTFDAVVSTSVIEHMDNKEECFREIHRILKPNGVSMHIFPSRWFLPVEPHIYVPLANYFGHPPRWWLALWGLAGVRNDIQREMNWRAVTDWNVKYTRTALQYRSNRALSQMSHLIFGNCLWPSRFFIDHMHGRGPELLRRLPLPQVTAWFLNQFRYSFMVSIKTISP